MSLRLRLRALFCRREHCAPVRGTVSGVIVVKAPAPCFREALFILRDEYLGEGTQSRDALLRQAREAAASYTGPASPPPPRRFLWLLPLLAAALLALKQFGVI